MPRLHRFHRANRDIDVRLSTSGTFSDFIRDGIDIAIRYGAGGYDGVISEFLAEKRFRLSAVRSCCRRSMLRTPNDLKHHRFIDNFRIDWATWLRAAGLDDINPNNGVRYDSAAYAVEAAVHGEGVLLGKARARHRPGGWPTCAAF